MSPELASLPDGPLPELTALLRLAKAPPEGPGPGLRVALLADTAAQLLAGALRGWARHERFGLDLFEGEFDQIELQVFDPGSAFHAFRPETVLIYPAAECLPARYGTWSVAERATFAARFGQWIGRIHTALSARGCQTICFNFTDPGDGVFGSYGNKAAWSLQNQIRLGNLELARRAQAHSDFHVYDLAALQAALGRAVLFNPATFLLSKFALTPEVLPIVARDVTRMLAAAQGTMRKCVILDLDNTLWGGVIGDDGLERIQIGELGAGPAFTKLQSWFKQLKDRGIVLAVCSKNDEATAREPFLKHPEMVLRLDDFAVFVANWQDKATNIRHVAQIINVGYAAMVFVDDNPAERALARQSFPGLAVPELPEDPAEYLPFLQSLNLFETASLTAMDAERTRGYQADAQRLAVKEKFVDQAAFLQDLNMTATVAPLNPFNIPRVAQLTQRSNQFNLRTTRYTEQQLETLARSPVHQVFTFELADRFGSHGLVSVVILEARGDMGFIETWLMSCRVLGRGVEDFVLNILAEAAQQQDVKTLLGEYLPTAKNGMVKEHYSRLGFVPGGENTWRLALEHHQPRTAWITRTRAN